MEQKSLALQSLYDVGRAMTSTLDFQTLLRQIMALSRVTIGSETASVMLADTETGELVLVCSQGLRGDIKRNTRTPSKAQIANWVYQNGKPVMLHGNAVSDPRFRSDSKRNDIRSAISVPLIGKEGPVGVLSLNNSTRRSTFTQEDLDLLTSIGSQAGIAVENARLHQQVEEANNRLTVTIEHLRNLKSALTSITSVEFKEALETMLDAAVEGTGALSGSLTILDQRNTIHRIEVAYDRVGLNLEQINGVNENEDSLFLMTQGDEHLYTTEHSNHLMIRVLSGGEKVRGLLKLVAVPEGSGFNSDDIEFVDALMEHASVIVFNNLLYQEAEEGREALEDAYGELQKKQELLVNTEKLAAVGRLAAWVCHEINNPLGAISGCAQLMQRKIKGIDEGSSTQEACKKYLGTIISETERCAGITGDLLQFSRQQELRLVAVDLHSILTNALNLIQYKYPSGYQFTSTFDSAIPLVTADPQQLTQVFLNLLTNAVQAIPEGGSIQVSTRYQPGGHARIEILDSGPGISEEDAARAFDLFYTTKQTGTGLGLPISKGIVEKHHGSLQLTGISGQGTLATIILQVNAGRKEEHSVLTTDIEPTSPPAGNQ